MSANNSWCGILLAAGSGRRFDASGQSNKLMQALPSGMTVAARSASHLLAVLPLSVAVVAGHTPALATQLAELGCDICVCSPASAVSLQGMSHSLQCGLMHAPVDCAGWIIALADMPYVKTETIAALVCAMQNGAGIAVPVHQGRRGNPVGFAKAYLPQLLALRGDQGARSLLKIYPVTEVEVDDAGIFQDIDLPQDLIASMNI
ncbi:nucleotidyltransferase family protein [Undibacterium sp.]|uniref:nucleotidyltransferase family protein n=1 Tax=Undibacterium sp. TaxID=1914977 RepID=UPI0025D71BB4|nr:nucleotidyltransferase family protein [Undibacterium sp.]